MFDRLLGDLVDKNIDLNKRIALLEKANRPVLDNHKAVVDPTASDDILIGYSVGSHWVNNSSDAVFVNVDNTIGAAVWLNVSGGATSTLNYIFAYDTSSTSIAAVGTLQDQPFSTNSLVINGWAHIGGTATFTNTVSGLYTVSYSVNFLRATGGGGGGTTEIEVIGVLAGVEVSGSHQGYTMTSKGASRALYKTFPIDYTAGQVFKLQTASDNTSVDVAVSPTPSGSLATAATIFISRFA